MKKLTKLLFLCSLVFLCFSCQKDTVAEQGPETNGDSEVMLNAGVDSKFKGAKIRAKLYVDKKRKKYPFIFRSTDGILRNRMFKFDVYSTNRNIKLHIDQLAFTSFTYNSPKLGLPSLKSPYKRFKRRAIYLNQKHSKGGLSIHFPKGRYKSRYHQVTIRVKSKNGWIRGRKAPGNKGYTYAKWTRGTCGYFTFRIKAYNKRGKIIKSRRIRINQMTNSCDRLRIKLK